MFALGAGIRFVVLVLGVRAKYNALSAFNMWQINGELGFKIPIGNVDILFGVHGGYSFVGSLGDGTVAAGSTRDAHQHRRGEDPRLQRRPRFRARLLRHARRSRSAPASSPTSSS